MKTTLPHALSASCLALLAACASSPPEPPVPANLVPAGEKPLLRVGARGVQIYECRAAEWVFVAPEAELQTADGQSAGKHYAGPRWEATDGSKIIGSVKARADAPRVGAIPWLLLTTKSDGGDGRFAKVTSVQRINTVGGVAPTKPCTPALLGTSERVPYTADYVLFTPG
jgi:hypothetical protein